LLCNEKRKSSAKSASEGGTVPRLCDISGEKGQPSSYQKKEKKGKKSAGPSGASLSFEKKGKLYGADA